MDRGYPRVTVSKKCERFIKGGHIWVYHDEIQEIDGSYENGDIVDVLTEKGQPVAVLRHALFWDSIPFCTMLYVKREKQRKGYGRILMEHWEQDMKTRGYGMVLTSTQEDEEAQHFYRTVGYQDCGKLDLPFPGYEQPTELILGKSLQTSGQA